MRVAIAVWEDRVSSVLDFSQQLVVVEFNAGGETSRVQIALPEQNALARLARLRELGIDDPDLRGGLAAAGLGLHRQRYPVAAVRDGQLWTTCSRAYQAGELGLSAVQVARAGGRGREVVSAAEVAVSDVGGAGYRTVRTRSLKAPRHSAAGGEGA
jgi:hypothetical protein